MPPPGHPSSARVTDRQVQTLLTRHRCPTPMHVLRMWFGGGESDWILEMVDAAGTSNVWDNPFETDQQAFAEAMRALDEEPLTFMEPTPGTKAN